MKKLLSGIFRPSSAQPQHHTPRKLDTPSTATTTSSSSSSYGNGKQSPNDASPPVSSRVGPRSSWGAFFAGTPTPRPPSTPPLAALRTPEKVFSQNLDILLREAAAIIKVVMTKMLESADFESDLGHLSGFVTLAADKLQQNGDPAQIVLKSYFESPAGALLCEQTAFPSLVLDFLGKIRVFLLKEELSRMLSEDYTSVLDTGEDESSNGKRENAQLQERSDLMKAQALISPDMERSIEFLMGCVRAIASNHSLMEIFRCEIPNLVQLSAEEYPPSALFLRDLSSLALAAIPDKNFNAGLVWYLHDCGIVAKTVKTIATLTAATPTTPDNAAMALRALSRTRAMSASIDEASSATKFATTAAAVGDALGMNKESAKAFHAASTDENVASLEIPIEDTAATEQPETSVESGETFCLQSYDPLPGIKSLVFVLQKTCRHSMVLLGEFQSSGGYALLTRLLKIWSEKDVSTLIYLTTLLLPLGTGYSGACGGDENMATIITCGARNISVFLAMRDLLMKCISELEILADGHLSDSMKARDEQLILQLLTTILHVYTSDYDNFLRLEPKTQTLALILTKLPWIAFYDAKVIVLRIVEYVCAAASPESSLPTELLSILCSLFIEYSTSETTPLLEVPQCNKETRSRGEDESAMKGDDTQDNMAVDTSETSSPDSTDHSLSLLVCGCIIKILQSSSLVAYREELNSLGLLERGVYAFFVKISNSLAALAEAEGSVQREYLSRINFYMSMWANLATLMLKDNWQLCVEFRELRVHQALYSIAEALVAFDLIGGIPRSQEIRGCSSVVSVFSVFVVLANFKISGPQPDTDDDKASPRSSSEYNLLQSGVESDMSKILELLQACRGSIPRQCHLLGILRQVLKGKEFVWSAWKSCQGHATLIAILSSIDDLQEDPDGSKFAMMDMILELFCEILDPVSGDDANRCHFKADVGHSAIANCLVNSGVVKTPNLPSVLNRVFELITGSAPPRNKIRCADAVHTLFCLLPSFEMDVAVTAFNRLLLKLTSNDEFSFSRRKQAGMLVDAGAFTWLADPAIATLFVRDTPLRAPLTSLILVLSGEELPTSRLREFLRVVARGMPQLLGNQYHPSVRVGASVSETDSEESAEIGLRVLEQVFNGPHVPHVLVGTHVKSRMASGYVHIVNNIDRVWPPSSGYSFACWVRFPPEAAYKASQPTTRSPLSSSSRGGADSEAKTSAAVEGNTVSVALCEGHVTITLDGDDTAIGECYCVLVGPVLTFFTSSESANRNESPVKTLDVTAVASNGLLDFYFWSHEKRFLAKCRTPDDTEMWLKAMQQSESISNVVVRNRSALVDPTSDDELLFVSETPTSSMPETGNVKQELEGYACILSVYSIESAGCFVRIYFEQATGCLRVDTGSVSSGPNINPNPKRTSAVFKNIDMNLLRATNATTSRSGDTLGTANTEQSEEDGSHWHHIALTHRKTVVGSSLLTLYIDGSEVTTKKLSYPSAPTAGSMQAFVGKDIQVCGTFPALPWSIGPAWLTEEVLSAAAIVCMFLSGPSFSGQFSGHAYRSAGEWPEAHATCQLDRATQRRVDVARFSKRLQLAKLGRASRRQWNEISGFGVHVLVAAANDLSAIAESATTTTAKKEDGGDGPRVTATGGTAAGISRKEQQKVEAFASFIKHDCAMSSFGSEMLQVLSNFKLPENLILFSLNTKSSVMSKSRELNQQHTHIQFVGTEKSWPLDLPKALPSVGGVTQMVLPLLENAWRSTELSILLNMLARAVRQNPSCLAECLEMNGYALIASMLTERIDLVNESVLESTIRLAISGDFHTSSTGVDPGCLDKQEQSRIAAVEVGRLSLIVDSTALSQIVLSHELRRLLPWERQCQIVKSLLNALDAANANALFNARQLRRAGLLVWIILFLSELCNEDCSLDKRSSLEHRWCFPIFAYEGFNELLQHLLSLLRRYLHVESHVDDIFAITDVLLLSLTSESLHRKESPFRVVILQFLLHEIESDSDVKAKPSSPSLSPTSPSELRDLVSPTIVDAVLYRSATNGPSKKRKDKHGEEMTGGTGGVVLSPTAGGSSAAAFPLASLRVDGVDNILLEIIRRTESGAFASIESLLALRILLSLAQSFTSFAQHLLRNSSTTLRKIKCSLQDYSMDGSLYIPILAYLSNVAIKDTKYCDAVGSPSARYQQYALPTPCGFLSPEKFCVDQVWELLGCLLLRNCKLRSDRAKAINIAVLSQLSFQTESSEAFFTTVCTSSSIVFRIIVQCVLSQLEQLLDKETIDAGSGTIEESSDSNRSTATDPRTLQAFLGYLISGQMPQSLAGELVVACFDLLKITMSRSLFEKDEFASFMMFLLECLDDGIHRANSPTSTLFSLADAQKSWLTLLVRILKSTLALSENCSFLVLRNLCTLGVALSRYLLDDSKHQGCTNNAEGSTAGTDRTSPSSRVESMHSGGGGDGCFGMDVLVFFLSSIRMCSEPTIVHLIGAEDQQFVYGCLVYCAQTVLLNELNGIHKGSPPPQRLLDCLVSSKHLLLQQTKCSSVIVCGALPSNHAAGNEATASGSGNPSDVNPPSQGGFSGRLNRMRSLSAGAHKEFGIGSESDRSFILSLAATLFRMIIDDSESVRHSSILMWQFLIQQRMGVLKELLIVEPRVSLLQNITTNKKEAIDVFHGGFERLLSVLPQRLDSGTNLASAPTGGRFAGGDSTSDTSASSRESWLQFHIWLTENFDLLKDLILVRTEPIYQHLIEVLQSCLSVRKVNSTSSVTKLLSQPELALHIASAQYFDAEQSEASISVDSSISDDADAVEGYNAAARKTMFKLSNIRESSTDMLIDSQVRWRDTLLQLLHTRSVWQMEGCQISIGSARRVQQSGIAASCSTVAGSSSETKPFYLDRSIFQQNAFKQCLDYTEGPQRMRLRLVRSYDSWDSAVDGKHGDDNSPSTAHPPASTSDHSTTRKSIYNSCATDDPFKRCREFHEAVAVFREFHFRMSTRSGDIAPTALDASATLTDILNRSMFERTRDVFAPDSISRLNAAGEDDSGEVPLDPIRLARKLADSYLGSTTSSEQFERTSVSEAAIAEIENVLAAAEADPLENPVPSTIFDIADSELMQSVIIPIAHGTSAQEESSAAVHSSATVVDSDVLAESDDEDDEAPSALSKPGLAGEEESDEEVMDPYSGGGDTGGNTRATTLEQAGGGEKSRTQRDKLAASKGVQGNAEREIGSDGDPDEDDGDARGVGLGKIDFEKGNSKIFDSSFDYVYGGVARFLQRDDHPPLQCYNAAYIAGMDKIDGIFLICRHTLYFLGGYEKLFYHAGESDTSAAGGAKSGFGNQLSPNAGGGGNSAPLSPGKPGTSEKTGAAAGGEGLNGLLGKKKTKNLIRSTLADLSNQFSSAKTANSQLFTIVPVLAQSDQPVASRFAVNAQSVTTTLVSKRWSIRYANVKQFSRIKYQLRPVGIEFFDTFGSTYFLQFESQSEREEIIKLMFQMPIVNSIFWSPLLRSSAMSLSVKRIRQALTKRWLRGGISNFEYLMHLNTLAGRSFNDITQYPVFPWVVADYKSAFLDLDDSATFRDLSKPMGALGDHRAAQFRERYNAMNEVGPGPFDSPAFHYGTHYSCSAYVVNYLIRLEPFTKLALELQGGSFDHADRLFCNIPSSWKSASTDNLQDVRELIPEFFYLPEFLYNSNNYDFGTTQSGEVVSQVRLPPWAQSDPREFIRVHRRALESKYVSENLHQWIDLIFGVKQTGQAALDAQNVFMHVTYEGTIDIDQIKDPVMRNATLSQIENFGQTPSRVFSSPHPQRKVPTLLSPSSLTGSSAIGHQYEGNTLSSIEAYVKWHTPLAPALVAIGKDYVFLKKALTAKALDEAVGDVKVSSSDKLQCRGMQCTFAPPRFTKYADWGSAADGTIKFRVHQSSARHREANKVIGVIEGTHYCPVNCAAFSDDGQMFVTGGQDGVVSVLECLKKSGQRIFKQFAKLVGHEDAVESVAINKEFNLVASGSADCCAILWDLRTRVFLRELVGHSAPVTKIAINSATGNVLTATLVEVRVWSINGDLLAAASTTSCGLSAITSAIATRCEMWQDGVVAVTGHSNGTIALWGLSYPSDIEREKRRKAESEQQASACPAPESKPPIDPSAEQLPAMYSRAAGARPAVRISSEQQVPDAGSSSSPPPVLKVIPSCQLFIMKLLLDHRAGVTALTLGPDQRQLLSGDADGNCIRWIDDSVSLYIL